MGPRAKVAGLVGACLAVMVGAVPGSASSSRPSALAASGGGQGYIGPAVRHANRGHWAAKVCAPPVHGAANCDAMVVTDSSGKPLASASPPSGAYGPSQFHTGYALPTTIPSGAPRQTIGIVDAYDDPNIESDLATYDSQYGLPACTTANDCFRKVDQNGGTSYPRANGGWAQEISLDVEIAHAICQDCKILLVEANSSSYSDLGTAEDTAASLGATVISNSYGGSESSGESASDVYYDHPGVAITVSAGDSDYGAEYPATSPYVTAVGGTTLNLNSNGSYASESVWNWGNGTGTGSGCSGYEAKPSWQTDPTCPNRMEADVSADADPNTGAAVYDSYSYQGQSGWFQIGGTSLSSPLVAGVYALTGAPQAAGQTGAAWAWAHAALLHDVTTGNNGTCSVSYYCTAGTGYDGPTGTGTPNGLGAFTSDFALTETPTTRTVTQGGGASYTVSLDQPSFPDAVTLSASGLPTGATASFSPASISGNATSTLTVTTSPTTPTGAYTLTIKGTSGALTHSTAATLTVSGVGPYTLSVSRSGSGSGSVTSSPAGISCGAICSFDYPGGTQETLSASPVSGSTFVGWSGGGCSGTGSCVVTMTQAVSVTATFGLVPELLSVSESGSGSGTVTSSPAGISCGSTCSLAFDYGTTVTLSATAATGSGFSGWSGGGCSGTGSCTATMTQAVSVTASFGLLPELLSVAVSGSGSGTVTSSPAGIDCGSTCSHAFDYGTTVTLIAAAGAGSTFAGWSGACSGAGSCTVTMSAAESVTATFASVAPPTYTLSVAESGSGSGSVTSAPAGISCGATCSFDYPGGTQVTLSASAVSGSTFVGWSGGGCSGTGSCTVTMSAAVSVTASFGLVPELLSVAVSGSGSGMVTSAPVGIACGSTCSHGFDYGTTVSLSAVAATGSTFAGWSGACSGTGSCVVTTNQARSVTATFSVIPETLTVTKRGHGAGKVTSSPAGVSCGRTCSYAYNFGSSVTLVARAAVGSVFAGWSGACSGRVRCTLSLTATRSVSASFRKVCLVPDVKGTRVRLAERKIKAQGCRVGKIERVFSTRVRNGHVISQTPKPRKRRTRGSTVDLLVSRGRKR